MTNSIGETLKRFRMMKNISAGELSRRTKIPAPNISAIENGNRVPKADMCQKMAEAMGVDPVELCGIKLTEIDEKRLLMKLLVKYAVNVEPIEDAIPLNQDDITETVYLGENQAVVRADLPIAFYDFAEQYQEYKEEQKEGEYGWNGEVVIVGPDGNFMAVPNTIDFWIENYPQYDAISICKYEYEFNQLQYDLQKEQAEVDLEEDYCLFENAYSAYKKEEEIKSRFMKKRGQNDTRS